MTKPTYVQITIPLTDEKVKEILATGSLDNALKDATIILFDLFKKGKAPQGSPQGVKQ